MTAASVPPGPYRRDVAEHMIDLRRPGAAFAYLRLWLELEVDRRFGEAIGRLR